VHDPHRDEHRDPHRDRRPAGGRRIEASRHFPPELVRFVELFNDGAFWDSHEVLEGPWRTHRSGFYHGLILYASAFVHVQRDNPHGIVAQLRKAEEALEPYAPSWLGVDVTGILQRCREIRQRVHDRRDAPPRRWAQAIPFPRLALTEERLRGDEAELKAG
jgi:hypothetical protein